MKKRLYLLRHSYAEPPGDSLDIDRKLTMEGISAARTMGRKLSSEQFNPQLILCSPASRAYETAMNLTEELDIAEQSIAIEDKIYEASVRELLEVVNRIDADAKNALLIGHNPSITYFGELLTSSNVGTMEPCGMLIIDFESTAWEEVSQASGVLVAYYHPNQ